MSGVMTWKQVAYVFVAYVCIRALIDALGAILGLPTEPGDLALFLILMVMAERLAEDS